MPGETAGVSQGMMLEFWASPSCLAVGAAQSLAVLKTLVLFSSLLSSSLIYLESLLSWEMMVEC